MNRNVLRIRKQPVIFIVLLLALTLLSRLSRWDTLPADPGPAGGPCADSYSLHRALDFTDGVTSPVAALDLADGVTSPVAALNLADDVTSPASVVCAAPPTDAALLRCLRRRRRARGRSVHVVFIGDSRTRNIFETFAAAINVTRKISTNRAAYPPDTNINISPRELCAKGKHLCSANATSDLVRLRMLWRPFTDRHFVASVTELVATCEADDGDCPDMVVIGGGLWYGTLSMPMSSRWWLALLRRLHGWSSSRQVARLAELTRVIWRLEETVFSEYALDAYIPAPEKSPSSRQILALQPLVYEELAQFQAPLLSVWASHLPRVTSAVFTSCVMMSLKDWLNPPKDCPLLDQRHLNPAFNKHLLNTLLAELCAGFTEATRTNHPTNVPMDKMFIHLSRV